MLGVTEMIVVTLAMTAFFVALPAHAQFEPLTFGTNLSIGLSPHHPRPGDAVHLTADGTGILLSDSAIVWRANGKVIAQGIGATAANVVAGALGSETNVEIDVAMSDGSVRSAQAILAPTELDVLISSDSYTPSFYRGRALPSGGTNLVAQALARFERADGTFIADSDITYTWKRDGEVLGGLSGRGKSNAVIPVMHLFTGNVITVDAASSDNTRSGETTVSLPTITPVLDLYEDHPLYGILYNKALGASAFIPEPEMVFAATPYFAQATSASDANFSYAWRVNDTPISPSTVSPNEITINASNSSGEANIALEVTHATNYFMYSKATWNITFSSGGSTPTDLFHTATQ